MKHDSKPLTLEELKKMDGQPVWCEYIADATVPSQWMVVEVEMERCGNSEYEFLFDDVDEKYGRMWLAYAQNPVDFDDWTAEWKEVVTHNGCTPDYDCVCSKCGASGVPNDDFCSSCGRAISENARELLERRLMGERN